MKQAFIKTINNFRVALPMIIGIFLLVNLLSLVLEGQYSEVFTGNWLLDPLLGAGIGSVSFGMPLTSYIVGGELLIQGVSLVAVTAFILAWTTVGVLMLPLEAKFLGKRFAITRNIINFFFAIIIAILTVAILNFIHG